MIVLGLSCLAIGLGDLVAGGMTGQPATVRSAGAGWATTALAMLALCWSAGWDGDVIVPAVAVWTLSIPWMALRSGAHPKPGWAVVAQLLTLTCVVLLAPAAEVSLPGALASWCNDHPVPGVRRLGGERLVAALGVLLLLGPTANGIVRATLQSAGAADGGRDRGATDAPCSAGDGERPARHDLLATGERSLRGGRLIGLLERWLIFALALGGQPTAAALVVSAKSLIRFPELTRKGQEDTTSEIDIVTEYFLLGSLLSWSLALFPALLLADAFGA